MFRKDLVKINEFNRTFEYMNLQSRQISDPDEILGVCSNIMNKLNTKIIQKLREKIRNSGFLSGEPSTTESQSSRTSDS